jgi:hypothetical protein
MMIGQFEEAVYKDRVKPVLEVDGREKWRSKLFTLNSIQKILPFWGMCRNSQMLVHKVLATAWQRRRVILLHSIRPNLNGGMIRAQGWVPYSMLPRALNAIRMA